MKKIVKMITLILSLVCFICLVAACTDDLATPPQGSGTETEDGGGEQTGDMRISVSDGTYTVVFRLNDSSASESLYNQLPFTVNVSNYGSNEKIFYPPESLDTSDVTNGQGPAGSLAYFSTWGNVVMYYGSYGPYNGLYALGSAVSGGNDISRISGRVTVEKAD